MSAQDDQKTTHFLAWQDFRACGAACEMRRHETVLGSVLRIVKERDELLAKIEAARMLLIACRRDCGSMRLAAYDDLQSAINTLEP